MSSPTTSPDRGPSRALALYRNGFIPSDLGSRPITFLTANVAVAESQAEAERLVRPNLLAMINLRTGGELEPQPSVEEAERTAIADAHRELAAEMRSRWVVGTADSVRAELEQLAATYAVDEIMIHPIAGAYADDPLDRNPAREATLQLLAG